ncbi:MAG: thioredoxin family protein [Flavobacteriales bacterium]
MKHLEKALEHSYSYNEYRELVSDLLSQNKSTTENGTEALVGYSKLNNSRMKRLDKTTKVPAEIEKQIKAIDQPTTWTVLSEGWCGDAAQNLPAIHKMAELNPMISLRIVLRDQNLELMNEYLTNGGQSIPKLIQTQDNEVTGTWGPRPTVATNMVQEYKEKHGSVDAEFKKELQLWYNKDKNESLFSDFLNLTKAKQTLEV